MKTLIPLTLAACLLTGCASMPEAFLQPPAKLVDIHRAAKGRITYQNYAKKDWRYIQPDTTGAGNCAVFAFTVMVDAVKAGYSPQIKLCRLPDGTGHAYTAVDGWALDVRRKTPIRMNEQDCK